MTRKPPTRPNRRSLLILPTLSISQPGSMVTTTPQPLHLSLSTSQQQGEPGSCSLGTKTEETGSDYLDLSIKNHLFSFSIEILFQKVFYGVF
jgi:hypothetical protein